MTWEKFEYKTFSDTDELTHSELTSNWGAYGWELVAIIAKPNLYTYYFKRKIQ